MIVPGVPLAMATQDSPGAGGTAETGDRYGASLDSVVTEPTGTPRHPIGLIVIGVPGEDLGGKADAGMVSFASFDPGFDPEEGPPIKGSPRTLAQNSSHVPGSSETGDRYGAAVLAGEFGQTSGAHPLDLVATAPLEDLGSTADAGMLSMTLITSDGGPFSEGQPGAWTQDSAGVAGTAERGDRFGAALSSVQLATPTAWSVTMVTVPREDIGSVADAGMAYLGVAPGSGSVALVPPVLQTGAGLGMATMQIS